MSLQKLLKRDQVLLGLEVTSKKRLFEEIGFLFERTAGVTRTQIAVSLFARERLRSTGLGGGVAIPHCRIKGLKEPLLAAIQLKQPLGFEALDGQAVDLLFGVIVPEHASQKHLDLLAEIADLISDDARRLALRAATDVAAFMRVVQAGSTP